MTNTIETRPLRVIAAEIRKDWDPVWYGAEPYVKAMETMDDIHDNDGVTIVLYFLTNTRQWRGNVARRIKNELREMIRRS